MNARILTLGVALVLLASACGTASAVSPTTTTVTHAAQPAGATMTPAEMAAMGSPSTTSAAQPAAPAAAPAVSPAPTIAAAAPTAAAPATTTAPAPSVAQVPTPAPVLTPAPAPLGTTVTVTLLDQAIKTSTASTSAGTVTFVATNSGTTIHELVVLQTAIAQGALPADPTKPGTVVEPGFQGKVANLAPGASGSVTLTLSAGSYVLICNEPAHYSALGMHTSFTVR